MKQLLIASLLLIGMETEPHLSELMTEPIDLGTLSQSPTVVLGKIVNIGLIDLPPPMNQHHQPFRATRVEVELEEKITGPNTLARGTRLSIYDPMDLLDWGWTKVHDTRGVSISQVLKTYQGTLVKAALKPGTRAIFFIGAPLKEVKAGYVMAAGGAFEAANRRDEVVRLKNKAATPTK